MQKSALQAEFNFIPKQPCVRMKIAWQLTGPKSLARDRTVTVRCDGNGGVECERFMCENMCIKHARATAYKYIKRNHRCLVRAPSASGGRTDTHTHTNTHTDIVPRHSFALRWRCRERSQSSTMVQFFVRVCAFVCCYTEWTSLEVKVCNVLKKTAVLQMNAWSPNCRNERMPGISYHSGTSESTRMFVHT